MRNVSTAVPGKTHDAHVETNILDLLNKLEHTANELTQELHAIGYVGIWETIRRRAEKGATIAMLGITNGNISDAAKRLDVNRNTLTKRAEYFGINVESIRGGAV